MIALDLLTHTIVGNGTRAQRHAPMTATGKAKYYTVHQPLTDAQIAAHLTGAATYAVPLIGTDGKASAGLIEQDTGGLDMARRILAAAAQRGVVMFAIVVTGSDGHDGCHPWALYAARHDPAAIRAQLRPVAELAGASTDEIYPSQQNIRLPLGLHQRTHTRGKLLLQSGEIFDLDDAGELEAAERAIVALPLNGAPPAVERPAPPAHTSDKSHYLNLSKPDISRAPRHQAGRADYKATLNRIRSEICLLAELERRGCQVVGRRGELIDLSGMAGDTHTHQVTYTLVPSTRGPGYIGKAKSPRGKMNSVDYPRGFDVVNLLADLDHGGSTVELMKWYNPIAGHQTRQEAPHATEPAARHIQPPTRRSDAEREQDRQRKTAAWAAEATAIREHVARAAEADDRLTNCDRAVLREMLGWAAEHNAVACWLGRASIARLSGYSLGSVKRSVMDLEEYGYFESSGAGGRPIDTARRNFSRGSCFVERTIDVAKDDPRIDLACDHDLESLRACEGAPGPQPDPAAADKLMRLELACYARNLAAELGDLVDAEQLAAQPLAAIETTIAQLEQRLSAATVDQVEPAPAAGGVDQVEQLAAGASYDPTADWTAEPPARRRAQKDTKQAAMDAKRRRGERYRAMLDDPPALNAECYKLRNKIKTCVSDDQRATLGEILKEAEHYRDLAYARRDAPVEPVDQPPARSAGARRPRGGGLTSSRAGGPPGSGVQPALF